MDEKMKTTATKVWHNAKLVLSAFGEKQSYGDISFLSDDKLRITWNDEESSLYISLVIPGPEEDEINVYCAAGDNLVNNFNPGRWIAYLKSVNNFNPGRWIAYLESLVPSAEKEIQRQKIEEQNAVEEAERNRWAPIDDSEIFPDIELEEA